MEFEFRSNGKVEVQLSPETEIEIAFVKAFLLAAEKKGGLVKLSQAPNAVIDMVVSIEK